MKGKTGIVIALAALLVGAASAAGLTSTVLNKRHRDALLDHGNRVADTWEIRYDSLTSSYEERGHTVTSQNSIISELEQTNDELANALGAAEAEALSLQEVLAHVEVNAPVTGEATPATGDSTQRVRLLPSTTLTYERSSVTLFGEIDLLPDLTYTGSLSMSADLWLATSVSRLPSGELQVNAWSDVPEIRFTEVEVINNLDDPLAPSGGGFFLFKPGTWIGVGLGAAAALLLTGGVL